MAKLCSMADAYIMKKIHSGEWIPSLDTGRVFSTMKKDFIKFYPNKAGYPTARGIVNSHIIWVAANGPVPYGMEIDHINGDKEDNRLCNLQLVSTSENKMLSRAKVTFAQAEEIRSRHAKGGTSYTKLAREYRVCRNTIANIVTNKAITKPVSTDRVSKEDRKKILSAYKNGRTIDTIRKTLKMQTAVVRQVLEEELSKEAKEANTQENKL